MKVETLELANKLVAKIKAAKQHIENVEEKSGDPNHRGNEYFTTLKVNCVHPNGQHWGDTINLNPAFTVIEPKIFVSLYLIKANEEVAKLEKQLVDLQDEPEAQNKTEEQNG